MVGVGVFVRVIVGVIVLVGVVVIVGVTVGVLVGVTVGVAVIQRPFVDDNILNIEVTFTSIHEYVPSLNGLKAGLSLYCLKTVPDTSKYSHLLLVEFHDTEP